MNLASVYRKIDENGIKIFPCDAPDIKAATIEINKHYGIFINRKLIKNSYEEFLVATHEYGHCMSGATHKLNSKFDLVSQHEYKADRRAVLDFLPVESIKNAINNGCHTVYEISDYLDIPEEFVLTALKHYTAMELI